MVNCIFIFILGNTDPDPDTPAPQTPSTPAHPAPPNGSKANTTEAAINLNNGGDGDNKCKGILTLNERECEKNILYLLTPPHMNIIFHLKVGLLLRSVKNFEQNT